MAEFLKRLTNVIHWLGFLVLLAGLLTREWAIVLLCGFVLTGSWAIKYVLTGRKGLFPWNTN